MKGKNFLFWSGLFLAVLGVFSSLKLLLAILGIGAVGMLAAGFVGIVIAGVAAGLLIVVEVIILLFTGGYAVVGVLGMYLRNSAKGGKLCFALGVILTAVFAVNALGGITYMSAAKLAASAFYAYGGYLNWKGGAKPR